MTVKEPDEMTDRTNALQQLLHYTLLRREYSDFRSRSLEGDWTLSREEEDSLISALHKSEDSILDAMTGGKEND